MASDKPGFKTTKGATILVTGSSGLVGARLVEMLLHRGAKKVICFDVLEPSETLLRRFKEAAGGDESKLKLHSGIEQGNLCNPKAVAESCTGDVDIVYHVAALVGPFHARDKYYAVNVGGTQNLLEACRKASISKFVFASSPSTRFHGGDIEGLREDQMTFPAEGGYLELYAETKAAAERMVSAACCDELLTIAVAPHQVYGPHDNLFLPSLLSTMGNGRLRIFGEGTNKISVCYVDNYCHGLMCGADALVPNSPALGKFYIITDDHDVKFWEFINDAGSTMGFEDLFAKKHLPVLLLMIIAHMCSFVTRLTGKQFKLKPFNVKMLIIHRYFSIENAKRDLMYTPVYTHEKAWGLTKDWFKVNWLPGFLDTTTNDKKDA